MLRVKGLDKVTLGLDKKTLGEDKKTLGEDKLTMKVDKRSQAQSDADACYKFTFYHRQLLFRRMDDYTAGGFHIYIYIYI